MFGEREGMVNVNIRYSGFGWPVDGTEREPEILPRTIGGSGDRGVFIIWACNQMEVIHQKPLHGTLMTYAFWQCVIRKKGSGGQSRANE